MNTGVGEGVGDGVGEGVGEGLGEGLGDAVEAGIGVESGEAGMKSSQSMVEEG